MEWTPALIGDGNQRIIENRQECGDEKDSGESEEIFLDQGQCIEVKHACEIQVVGMSELYTIDTH